MRLKTVRTALRIFLSPDRSVRVAFLIVTFHAGRRTAAGLPLRDTRPRVNALRAGRWFRMVGVALGRHGRPWWLLSTSNK